MMIVFAIVAVVGALLVYFVFVDSPERQLAPPPPPPPPKPVQEFQPMPVQAWDKAEQPEPPKEPTRPRNPGTSRPRSLADSAVGAGIRRMSAGFNRCAREYGGVDGSEVRVGFSVDSDGSVTRVQSMPPYTNTPLGRCVASVLGSGRFGRSEQGRSDIRWSIILHP
ncbi:MAG: hypothetical protein AB1Z98_00575 [Nannocystaceae bacterium]